VSDHSSDDATVLSGALETHSEASGEHRDAVIDAAPAALRTRVRARVPRRDWRLGGRTVLAWREWLLAIALISLGIGVLFSALLGESALPVGQATSVVVLWLGMLAPVVWAFTRSRPAGLLRFRALDVLWGVAFALALRLTQGWLAIAFGDSAALPSYPLVAGSLSTDWWFTDLVSVVAIAPVLEELFFRAVIVVALFTVLRRGLGKPIAGVIAVLVSSGLFVVVHALNFGLDASQIAGIGILGIICAALVMLTGRIWGAVLVHVLYNASFVMLALVGTFLG
jgi:uncharacterized protein